MLSGDEGGKRSVVSTVSSIIAVALIAEIKLDERMPRKCQFLIVGLFGFTIGGLEITGSPGSF